MKKKINLKKKFNKNNSSKLILMIGDMPWDRTKFFEHKMKKLK